MGKFSSVARGVTARKPVTLSLLGGVEDTCALVPLLADAEVSILSEARAFAVSKGVTEPKDGDPIYELAKWVYTLVHACVDTDSPLAAPQPYFDGGAPQILHPTEGLDRDRIALLYQQQCAWQDECAPSPGSMSPGDYLLHVVQHAVGGEMEELPFERWRHVIQRSFVRTICKQLVASLGLKSDFGSISPESERSSTSSSPSAPSSSNE